MNLLTDFHEDRTTNVASRVLTRKNAPPLGGHVFQANITIFELIQDIIKTNLLTILIISSRLDNKCFTTCVYSHIRKNAPPPGGHVFKPIGIIFELIQDIIGMNLLTKKNAPPLGSHVFQAKVTIFELIQDISGTNLLSKKYAPSPGGHVFQPTGIIFELIQDIIGMNLLTKFYEDQTINVASRVLTRFYSSHIKKNAPPLGSHVVLANVTIFELIQVIIETNLLTKFHEDWTKNVASRELTRQILMPHNAQWTPDKKRSQKLTMSTLCSVNVVRTCH
ncbi:hypothetical protein DPMN_102355, partial [Dreissena polymorpha]